MSTPRSSSCRNTRFRFPPFGPPAAVAMGLVASVLALACDRQLPDAPGSTSALVVDSCRGVTDGALCNDQNPCTIGDKCTAGMCAGMLAPDGTACTDNNQCTASDACLKGVCTGAAVVDGTMCTDDDPCTNPDACQRGKCVEGPPVSCEDGDSCTADRCVEGSGCKHDPIPMCSDAAVPGDGGDGGGPDLGGLGDATMDADGGLPDALPGDDAVGPDAPGPDGTGPDGEVPDGAPPDTDAVGPGGDASEDDGVDGGPDVALPDALPIYEARGGACVCSAGNGADGLWALPLLALGLAVCRRRRRRS